MGKCDPLISAGIARRAFRAVGPDDFDLVHIGAAFKTKIGRRLAEKDQVELLVKALG